MEVTYRIRTQLGAHPKAVPHSPQIVESLEVETENMVKAQIHWDDANTPLKLASICGLVTHVGHVSRQERPSANRSASGRH
jgi:hypothetical protein